MNALPEEALPVEGEEGLFREPHSHAIIATKPAYEAWRKRTAPLNRIIDTEQRVANIEASIDNLTQKIDKLVKHFAEQE